jgi:hypothetical protein
VRLTVAVLLATAAGALVSAGAGGASSGFGCKLVVEQAIEGNPAESQVLVGGCAVAVDRISGSIDQHARIRISPVVIDGPNRRSVACTYVGHSFACGSLGMKIGQAFVLTTRPRIAGGTLVRVAVRATSGQRMTMRARAH